MDKTKPGWEAAAALLSEMPHLLISLEELLVERIR